MFNKRLESKEQKPATVSDKKTDIYLKDSIVRFPQKNVVYHLKSSSVKHNETLITFSGDAIDDHLDIDLSSLNGTMAAEVCFRSLGPLFTLVSSSALPFDDTPQHMLPLLYVFMDNKLIHLKTLDITFNKDQVSTDISTAYTYLDKPDNQSIQHEIQKIAPNATVATSNQPIFLKKNRPDYAYFESLYASFVSYNDKSKLDFQFKNAAGKCHIRAHFINTLLAGYGVQTFKIFKFWNLEDWKPFPAGDAWRFHCAAMMIDKENNFFVWDPWHGHSQKLQTPNQWLFRADEPRPKLIVIANSICLMVSDKAFLTETTIPHFMHYACPTDVRTLQAAFSNAIPHSPELSISEIGDLKKQAFFYFNQTQDRISKKRKTRPLDFSSIEKDVEKPSSLLIRFSITNMFSSVANLLDQAICSKRKSIN